MSKSSSFDNILYPIDSKEYLNKSERNIQRVNNKLDDYLKAPNEEHIHDIERLSEDYGLATNRFQNQFEIKRK